MPQPSERDFLTRRCETLTEDNRKLRLKVGILEGFVAGIVRGAMELVENKEDDFERLPAVVHRGRGKHTKGVKS